MSDSVLRTWMDSHVVPTNVRLTLPAFLSRGSTPRFEDGDV